MTTDFDPYYKWLGIPPEEQPPNHYRLLGIPPFTSDMEVIDNAVDQRMAHLRSFQIGQRSHLCQQLLNEVAAVKASLQDPEKKAAYDAALYSASCGNDKIFAPTSPPSKARVANKTSQRAVDSVGIHLIKHCLGSVAGLCLGYLVLLSFGSKYDFLHLHKRFFPKAEETSLVPKNHALEKQDLRHNPQAIENSHVGIPALTPQEITDVLKTPPSESTEEVRNDGNDFPKLPLEKDTSEDLAAQHLRRSEQALDEGNLTGALAHIEEYCKFTTTNSSQHKLAFLTKVLSNHTDSISDNEVVSDMIRVLEQSAMAGEILVTKKYLPQTLIAARKTKNEHLIRRATLLALKTK